MKKVVLDNNVYDELHQDIRKLNSLVSLVNKKQIEVLMPIAIERELQKSPYRKEPADLMVRRVHNSAFVADISPTDVSRVGSGKFYTQHLGNSKAKNAIDALIADLAALEADYIVTNDKRFTRRFDELDTKCKCMKLLELFNQFQ
ncbi:hypothetical protein [Vibrio sp. VB16]|uniref:hypothetical protein n=1 Tax=Vibrio sp. VB16 TaxID=2785746 RepID=UPI00189DCFFA|nr:hypothetical protein [Vibrio sp. VB16]UGA55425.1 hypothetical protein IUZ65_003460 [Vibrio sp. VB16]